MLITFHPACQMKFSLKESYSTEFIRCCTGQQILKDTFLGFSPSRTGLTIVKVLAAIFSKKNSNLRPLLTTTSPREAVFREGTQITLDLSHNYEVCLHQFAQHLTPAKAFLQKPVLCFPKVDLQTCYFWGGWKLSCWGADSFLVLIPMLLVMSMLWLE